MRNLMAKEFTQLYLFFFYRVSFLRAEQLVGQSLCDDTHVYLYL